jgi:hypothetical protein
MSVMKWAQEFTHEQAYDEINKMTDVEVSEGDGVTVYLGTHPDHGKLHIIIPAGGSGMMLFPTALLAF